MRKISIGGSDRIVISGLNKEFTDGAIYVFNSKEDDWATVHGSVRAIKRGTSEPKSEHARLNMSRTWYWRPVVKPPAGMRVEDRMLEVFRTRARRTSHFGNENDEFPMILTKADIPWLNGLTDAGITEAGEFVSALNNNAEVEVYFEY